MAAGESELVETKTEQKHKEVLIICLVVKNTEYYKHAEFSLSPAVTVDEAESDI